MRCIALAVLLLVVVKVACISCPADLTFIAVLLYCVYDINRKCGEVDFVLICFQSVKFRHKSLVPLYNNYLFQCVHGTLFERIGVVILVSVQNYVHFSHHFHLLFIIVSSVFFEVSQKLYFYLHFLHL